MYFKNIDSLQELCLKIISSHFDAFLKIFQADLNEHSQRVCIRGIKTIKKKYSDQILKILADRNEVKNEHLEFLLNEYTRQIILLYLIPCDFHSIEARLREIGSSITKFSMAGQKKFLHCDSILANLTKIQILELTASCCSDKSLRIIVGSCSELKSLDLSHCTRITNQGLEYLCEKPPALESLNLENTSVTYVGVARVLQTIPSLTKLWFENTPRAIIEIFETSEKALPDHTFKLSNIAILNTPLRPENHLSSQLIICAESCPMITDLLVGEIVTEEQLELCQNFKNLEAVRFQGNSHELPQLDINNFLATRGEKLCLLTLTSLSLSIEVLANSCKNLECLTLQNPTFQATIGKNICLSRLKMLRLQNVDFNDEDNLNSVTKLMRSSTEIEALGIIESRFSDEIGVAILGSLHKLKHVDFTGTPIEVELIEDILRTHENLVSINISNSGISMAEYDDLMDLVDELENGVRVDWADYNLAIQQLFMHDHTTMNPNAKRCILKL